MTNLPPSGSRTIPTRARKSNSGVDGSFGSAIKAGMENVSKDDVEIPKVARKTPQIRIARQTYNNLIATKILKMFLLALLGFAILYVCFAATIIRVIPSSSAGPVLTKNLTFPGGLVPAGSLVVVDVAHAQGGEMMDYLKQAFVPSNSIAIMRVAGGPWGNFDWDQSGVVSYKGKIVAMTIPEATNDEGVKLGVPATHRGDTSLQNEYLMACVSGACVPGRGYVFPSNHIMGQPIGKN